MRKVSLLLAALLAVTFSTAADAAKKKAAPKPDPAIQAQKDTAAFMAAAFNPFTAKGEVAAKPAKKKMAKKGGKKKKG